MRTYLLAALIVATSVGGKFAASLTAADPAEAVIEKAQALLKQRKPQEGRDLLEKAAADWRKEADAKSNDADAPYQLAQIYLELSRDSDAERSIDQAIARDGKRAEFHFLKGTIALYGDQPAAAIPSLRRAVELAPENPDYRDRLARVYMATGDDDKAEPQFEALIKIDPKNVGGLLRLAMIHRRRENYDKAVEFVERGLAVEPKNLEALMVAGIVYQMADRPAEHLAVIKRLVEIAPDNEYAVGRLLLDAANAGRKEEAADYRKKLIALHGAGKTASPFFDREEFAVGKSKVLSQEFFELQGARAVRYAFHVTPPDGASYRISLGSYEFTNQAARAAGTVKADERIFHLDWYGPVGEHRTYGMYDNEPTYERTRELVQAIIEKKIAPISGFTPKAGVGGEIKLGN